jgi:hypothetical protein
MCRRSLSHLLFAHCLIYNLVRCLDITRVKKIMKENNIFIKTIDTILFIFTLSLGSLLSVYGNHISAYLFKYDTKSSTVSFTDLRVYFIVLFTVLIYDQIRKSKFNIQICTIICSILGLFSSLIMQLVINSPSVFFLQLHLYIITSGIVMFSRYIRYKATKDFWSTALNLSVYLIRFVLIIYIALCAAIRIMLIEPNQSVGEFAVTYFIPTFVVILSLVMYVYWVMVPCWSRLFDACKQDETVSIPRIYIPGKVS